MSSVFAYMSKPGKSGKRKYAYQNYNTNEYSLEKVDGVEYKESKLVYSLREHLARMEKFEELYSRCSLEFKWKNIV